MGERKLFVDEDETAPVRVQRAGLPAYGFIRTLFDPEIAGTANAVLGVMTIPPGQPEPMLPHAHFQYDESEYAGRLLCSQARRGMSYSAMSSSRDGLFCAAGYPHCVANTGEGERKIAFSFYPAGIAGLPYREIATDLTDQKKVE